MWCEICAAIDIAKADVIAGISFDESDKNNNSILNVMTTIITGDEVRQLTMNGVTLMAVKTAQSNADAIVKTYKHAQGWLQECHDLYSKAGPMNFFCFLFLLLFFFCISLLCFVLFAFCF